MLSIMIVRLSYNKKNKGGEVMRKIIGCVVLLFLFLTGTVWAVPVPSDEQVIPCYAGVDEPVTGSDPLAIKPLGLGAVADGGNTLSLHVGFDQFSGPVDIYVALGAPAVSPDLFMLTESSIQAYSASAPLPSLRGGNYRAG